MPASRTADAIRPMRRRDDDARLKPSRSTRGETTLGSRLRATSDELGRLLARDLEQPFLERVGQVLMSSTLTTSSNASMPVSSALSMTSASEGRVVEIPMPMRVIGSSPNSGDLVVVSGKCSASNTLHQPRLARGDHVQHQIVEDEPLQLFDRSRLGVEQFLQAGRRKVGVGQHPGQRASHLDPPRVGARLRDVVVVERRDLEADRRRSSTEASARAAGCTASRPRPSRRAPEDPRTPCPLCGSVPSCRPARIRRAAPWAATAASASSGIRSSARGPRR